MPISSLFYTIALIILTLMIGHLVESYKLNKLSQSIRKYGIRVFEENNKD
jgi:hypothetical protein